MSEPRAVPWARVYRPFRPYNFEYAIYGIGFIMLPFQGDDVFDLIPEPRASSFAKAAEGQVALG